MILSKDFDPNNTDHIDYFLSHLKYYNDLELQSIYNILDVTIKEESTDLFFQYNIRDVELVEKLDDKLKLIEQVFAIAYDAKVLYADTLTTIRMWDTIIHNYLLNQYIVVPPMKKNPTEELLGGYVKEPQLGLHKWVVSLDIQSEYPNIIIGHQISPDTFIEKIDGVMIDDLIEIFLLGGPDKIDEMKDKSLQLQSSPAYKAIQKALQNDLTLLANGCLYKRDKQGFLGKVTERVYNDRVLYKEKMIAAKQEYEKSKNPELKKKIAQYSYLQMAKKIQMNALYGSIANPWFRYYNHNDAEAITSTGQLAIRWIETRLNKYLNGVLKTENKDYIIASDTDSIYVDMSAFITGGDNNKIVDALDRYCKVKLLPFIAKCYKELAEYTNAYKNRMEMKREVIAEKGLWTAKKRAVLLVWDKEGVRYKEPQLSITGIESVRSSTPSSCRANIKEALEIIMRKDEKSLQEFIKDFYDKFNTFPVDEVAFPRSISGMGKYKDSARIYAKATPIQVKGALIYNNLITKNGLDKRYPLIYNGDKCKFVYLREPNPIHEHVISFVNVIPKEFGIDAYIDYELQFEKGFLGPISTVLSAIGWKLKDEATLESFM